MKDLVREINKISVKNNEMLIITISNNIPLDLADNLFDAIKTDLPDLKLQIVQEGFINNIKKIKYDKQ